MCVCVCVLCVCVCVYGCVWGDERDPSQGKAVAFQQRDSLPSILLLRFPLPSPRKKRGQSGGRNTHVRSEYGEARETGRKQGGKKVHSEDVVCFARVYVCMKAHKGAALSIKDTVGIRCRKGNREKDREKGRRRGGERET